MMDVMQRVIALEASMQTLRKRLEETAMAADSGQSGGMLEVADYSNYVGPFMLGCLGGATVRVSDGYVLAPGGGWYWSGGTGALAGPDSTTYVTLDITMDGDTVDSAAVGAYTSLDDVTSTPGMRRVLIGVVTRSNGAVRGRKQQQRGNIYLSNTGAQPVLDIVVTGATMPVSGYYEMPIGLDEYYGYATIDKRYLHAATYEVASAPGGTTKNTIKFLDPASMYELTITGSFSKVTGTAAGDTDRPRIVISKGASSAANAAADMIHAMGYRQGVFIEQPAVYGYTASPEPSADTPDVYAPRVGEFEENWAITTLIVPEDDLTDDTLSLWGGQGLRTANYEIVIRRIEATYDE